ncbi:unnamed protein product [Xylocopa violacea]|uniref:Uncharacterized protein n=1 Tax=Xylocopa violacea TaxID=135666 RepID=A0ABP1NXG3_XYLVO
MCSGGYNNGRHREQTKKNGIICRMCALSTISSVRRPRSRTTVTTTSMRTANEQDDDDEDDSEPRGWYRRHTVVHFHEYGRDRRTTWIRLVFARPCPAYRYISICVTDARNVFGQVNGQLITYQLGDQWHRLSARSYVRHAVDVAVERIVSRMPARKLIEVVRLLIERSHSRWTRL